MADSLAALRGAPGPLGLPSLRHVIVVLIDGLGAAALADRAGHARTLSAGMRRETVAGAVFPSTTVAGLATLTTGVLPGEHGMVGYTAYDPRRDRIVNLLSGWGAGSEPEAWQAVPTLFERAGDDEVSTAAIGPSRYAGTGFSRAILRGAEYLSADALDQRVLRAREHAASAARTLSYLYIPELDAAGHKHGVASAEWVSALETADAGVAALVADLPRRTGVLVTADHGALDVPPSGHVMLDVGALSGVRLVAGEPRCLQLHLEPGVDPSTVASALEQRYGDVGWVVTRSEAIEADLFGPVRPGIDRRIGDVLLGARRRVAFYTDPADRARGMIGQHGSLSPEELGVPLLRFGAAA
ncbi:MAG: alkaline phosphatase family protein [Micrococcales bacterium]|nr:alkaline phosphatase family protein [Micrococcales bacterium]